MSGSSGDSHSGSFLPKRKQNSTQGSHSGRAWGGGWGSPSQTREGPHHASTARRRLGSWRQQRAAVPGLSAPQREAWVWLHIGVLLLRTQEGPPAAHWACGLLHPLCLMARWLSRVGSPPHPFRFPFPWHHLCPRDASERQLCFLSQRGTVAPLRGSHLMSFPHSGLCENRQQLSHGARGRKTDPPAPPPKDPGHRMALMCPVLSPEEGPLLGRTSPARMDSLTPHTLAPALTAGPSPRLISQTCEDEPGAAALEGSWFRSHCAVI